jgi:5-methylcytosine-specific restriction endonuclease McrA
MSEKTLKEQIIELRDQGLTYDQIKAQLQCSKSTICYHLTDQEKVNTRLRSKSFKATNPLAVKLSNFITTSRKGINNKVTKFKQDQEVRQGNKAHKDLTNNLNYKEVYEILSQNSQCYLTGLEIDLSKPATYQLDHILPISRGGTSTLDNMGLTSKDANQAKRGMTNDEFFELCASVIAHNDLLDLVYSKMGLE